MREAIKNFNTQFEYQPKIENQKKFKNFSKCIISGMGGSNLTADLLKIRDPNINILIHRGYGLPAISLANKKSLIFIASSYSGETEETINSLQKAIQQGLPSVVITTGGTLLKIAQKNKLPFIKIPKTNIQPRMATGFNIKALLMFLGRKDLLKEISKLSYSLKPILFEKRGQKLAQKLYNHIPIIYTSNRNLGIAYNWKIKFNETGKIPAFFNTLPELNHNEMTGFDVKDSSRALSLKFYFIFLRDVKDEKKIQKRMNILKQLYLDRGFMVEDINLSGVSVFHKIFSTLLLADWTAYYTAKKYNLEPKNVPMVEEFKGLISDVERV